MPTLNPWILTTLEDIKAQDIRTHNVEHLSNITDFMVICTGTSSTHLKAIANKLIVAAKENGVQPYGTEGLDQGEWVLIDLDDAVVHIMLEETRAHYDLEKLWQYTEDSRDQHEN